MTIFRNGQRLNKKIRYYYSQSEWEKERVSESENESAIIINDIVILKMFRMI